MCPHVARPTGRTSHHERPFTLGYGQRELTRLGSGASIAIARWWRQVRHTPRVRARPPGVPVRGPGSPARYIANRVEEFVAGSAERGERVWWYVPDVLLGGDRAPVVIYLHGFRAAIPDLYSEHIHHLTRQGILVVFPRYNKASLSGMLTDNDQLAMMHRAVTSVDRACEELGERADTRRVFAFGHSLGGLFAACWQGSGGIDLAGMVLAHPSLSLERIPAFVRRHVRITPLPHERLIPYVRTPVVMLCGDADTIAPTAESARLYELLERAPGKALYEAQSDAHGAPRLQVGHLATLRDDSHALHWMLERCAGGTAGDDTLHHRFYYAALDCLVHGDPLEFDMGCWSDGTPVRPVRTLRSNLLASAA